MCNSVSLTTKQEKLEAHYGTTSKTKPLQRCKGFFIK